MPIAAIVKATSEAVTSAIPRSLCPLTICNAL